MVYSALTVTKNEDEASLMIHIQIALYTVANIKILIIPTFPENVCPTACGGLVDLPPSGSM
jgi:hypothetical protein